MKKNCFVVIGFGTKTDYSTGSVFDLDKTYDNIIKPVCKALKIDCYRAKDIVHSGVIETPMYEWLYKADIVVADISTLNPNALYELGVRHALKPFSTIVISEKGLKYPFDINHTIIEPYEHLGKDIGVSEAKRFKKELKTKIKTVLKGKKPDSPVYTYLKNLKPPKFEISEIEDLKEKFKNYPSISELISNAEEAKNNNDLNLSEKLLDAGLKLDKNNSFIRQRLALVTYKLKKPNPLRALKKSIGILQPLRPDETNDPETLGLSGAIFKRIFEITGKVADLEKAIWYYERGFYITQDYYNGVNAAFLYDMKAALSKDKKSKILNHSNAIRIRQKTIQICQNIIKRKGFSERTDKNWIFQSIAQSYLGLRDRNSFVAFDAEARKYSKGPFDIQTYDEQNAKVRKLLSSIPKL
ncbi:MAG: tetratricopeptide repeat-containing protein [Smithella sp.]